MKGHAGRVPGENYVVLRFPSWPQNVAFARAAVAVFASRLEFTLDELDELKVAVSEAVSNTVVHAYPDDPGEVVLEMRVDDDGAFVLVVEDEGVGIEDVASARRAQWTSMPEDRMGLGFTFMQEYTDNLDVHSVVGRGTRVTMSKAPARAVVAG